MGNKSNLDVKSDDIEIISIGELYTGLWDKKYWSSSRGKDRYPYPVGYKSLRTQNGVTYKMEIVEGLKGPSFTISSSEGKSCSGDTPDIAWESFQKKGCSRIKLLRGKRFSCKIDGVEFFGFKNTFVQRLMRQLVANVGGTTDRNLLPSSFSTGVSTVNQLQGKESSSGPDLQPYLEKSHVTRKRTRNEKVSSKRLNDTQFIQHQQEKNSQNGSASNSKQKDVSNYHGTDLSMSASANEIPGFCNIPGALGPESSSALIGKSTWQSSTGSGLQLDSLATANHLRVEGGLFPEQRQVTSSSENFGPSVDNIPKNQDTVKYRDRPKNIEVQQFHNSVPDKRKGGISAQHITPVVNDSDLCVPDTLDQAEDSSSPCSLKNQLQVHGIVEDAIVNNVVKSEILATDSLPENESGGPACSANFSEKCDTDSVGEDIAKSMMTVLLPRALPLLKTFTRKKKKNAKPSVIPTHRSQEEKTMPNLSSDDAPIDKEVAKHLDPKIQKACTPSAGHGSVVSVSVNVDSMVPDSFDNYDAHNLPPAAIAGQESACLDLCAQLPISVDAEANSVLQNGIGDHDKNHQCERQTVPGENPNKGSDTWTADVTLATADSTPVPIQEISVNSKKGRFDCHSIVECPPTHASTMKCTPRSEITMCKSFSDIGLPEKSEVRFAKVQKDKDTAGRDNAYLSLQVPSSSCCCSVTDNNEIRNDPRSKINPTSNLDSKLKGLLELSACYVHPTPISMVQLIVKGNEIFFCVLSGCSEHVENTLFVYKALREGEKMGCPSLIGHMPIARLTKNGLCRDISLGSSLQLTPNERSLVLSNSIKTPYCREGKLHCPCLACASDCFEKNAVKIVQLHSGYASLVMRLGTNQGVCCILVCEPSFLLAAEEGGKLKLWTMNSGWSGQKEDCYLPSSDCMFPSILELKRIPKSAILVVGHNGFGEFGLWDIDKRILVSRFSSPGMSVLECIPVSIFRWQRKGECNTESLVDEIMNATKRWFSGASVSPTEAKDVGVWVLISTVPDPDSQCYQSYEQEAKQVGYWRLALLVNNVVITGSAVDGGVAAVTSGGHGIMGRCDGLVYMWELSTGMKLGNLHTFKGQVSCITTDTSGSDALAVASGNQLLVFLPS